MSLHLHVELFTQSTITCSPRLSANHIKDAVADHVVLVGVSVAVIPGVVHRKSVTIFFGVTSQKHKVATVVDVRNNNSSLVQVRSHLIESQVIGFVESILIPENARRINKGDLRLNKIIGSIVSIIAS